MSFLSARKTFLTRIFQTAHWSWQTQTVNLLTGSNGHPDESSSNFRCPGSTFAHRMRFPTCMGFGYAISNVLYESRQILLG
jgi:hypothetical protein